MSDPVETKTKLQRLKVSILKPFNKASAYGQKCCVAAKDFHRKSLEKLKKPLTEEQKKIREVWSFRAFVAGAFAFCFYSASMWNDSGEKAKPLLEKQGVTHVSLLGYKAEPTPCNLAEPFRVAFSGVKDHQWVTGVVCKNLIAQRRVTFDKR